MKIGILTWHYFCNFGSALQAYALQKYLESAGHQVKIINYRNPEFNSTADIKRAVLYIISKTARGGGNIIILIWSSR